MRKSRRGPRRYRTDGLRVAVKSPSVHAKCRSCSFSYRELLRGAASGKDGPNGGAAGRAGRSTGTHKNWQPRSACKLLDYPTPRSSRGVNRPAGNVRHFRRRTRRRQACAAPAPTSQANLRRCGVALLSDLAAVWHWLRVPVAATGARTAHACVPSWSRLARR